MPDTGVVGQIDADRDAAKDEPVSPLDRRASRSLRAGRPLPSDRLSFSKQLELLRAYAVASGGDGKVVTNAELASLSRLNVSTASVNNTFFADSGLLEKSGNGYVPVADVIAFHRAHQWNPETAGSKLAPVLRASWFGTAIIPRLALGPLEEREAIAVLASASDASPQHEKQLRTLLDYLSTANLIERDGHLVREGRVVGHQDATSGRTQVSQPEAQSLPALPEPPAPRPTTATVNQSPEGGIQIHVDVNVTMQELSNWRPEVITAFFGGIAQVMSAKAMMDRDVKAP